MKGKILGLLAAALLAGPMGAHAAYIYTFANSASNPTASASFTVADFVTATDPLAVSLTTVGVSYTDVASTLCAGFIYFGFGNAVSAGGCDGSGSDMAVVFFPPPTAVGDYIADVTVSDFGATALPYLRISATSVPEPGTLALLGLGLAGLGMSRRRKAN